MKKKLSVFLSAILAAAALAGCTSNTNPTGPINDINSDHDTPVAEDTTEVQDNTENLDYTSDIEDTDTQPVADEEIVSDEDDTSLYQDFLDGNAAVYASYLYAVPDGYYTLPELMDALVASEEANYMPSNLTDTSYAYIDCGNNGAPELALKFTLTSEDPTLQIPSTYYFVIRPIFGELTVITAQNDYYRSETTMNKYGYFTNSGSGGASMGSQTASYITSDGEYIELYGCTTNFGLPSPALSEALVPFSVCDELNGGPIDYLGDPLEVNYTAVAYRFEEAVDQNNYEDFDEYYSDFTRQYVYTFYDNAGNPVMPDQEYIDKAAELGYRIITDAEMQELIEEQFASYGISDEIINAGEPEWISIN